MSLLYTPDRARHVCRHLPTAPRPRRAPPRPRLTASPRSYFTFAFVRNPLRRFLSAYSEARLPPGATSTPARRSRGPSGGRVWLSVTLLSGLV